MKTVFFVCFFQLSKSRKLQFYILMMMMICVCVYVCVCVCLHAWVCACMRCVWVSEREVCVCGYTWLQSFPKVKPIFLTPMIFSWGLYAGRSYENNKSETEVRVCGDSPPQNKRDQHILKRRNVPAQDSTDSDDGEKPTSQSLQTIVLNAASPEPAVQLSAVQAARYWWMNE